MSDESFREMTAPAPSQDERAKLAHLIALGAGFKEVEVRLNPRECDLIVATLRIKPAPADERAKLAKIIREEIVRQYRDDERRKCPAGVLFYEEQIGPYKIAEVVLAALRTTPAPAVSEEDVARVIDGTAFSMQPSHYGLRTEEELLNKTLVGSVREIALCKARKILALFNPTPSTTDRGVKDGF